MQQWIESARAMSRRIAVAMTVHGEAQTPRQDKAQAVATVALLGGIVLLPAVAHAAGQPWEDTAQKAYDLIMSIVRWVAVIAVVGCGVAAMFGKLSWDWAGKIIIGLVLIFGATELVDYFKSGM